MLLKVKFCGKLYLGLATMAQSVERRLGKAEVTGSIPVSSFWYKILHNYIVGFFSLYDRKTYLYEKVNCMLKKKIILAACICACSMGVVISSGCISEGDVDYMQEETTHFAEPDLVRHKVGETFECEEFIFTYNSVKQVDSVNDGKNKPVEGKVFYQLELTVENKADVETHVNYNCFIGFADDELVDQFYFTEDVIKGNLVKAGDSVTGTLTYSVPEDAEKVEVIFQYDMFHEEKVAFTVK